MITTNNLDTLEESLDLLKALKTNLNQIFNLDSSDVENEELQYCFKVLIFDDYVFDIISPLLKVNSFLITTVDLQPKGKQHNPSYEHQRKKREDC